jgi:hypothetical protein
MWQPQWSAGLMSISSDPITRNRSEISTIQIRCGRHQRRFVGTWSPFRCALWIWSCRRSGKRRYVSLRCAHPQTCQSHHPTARPARAPRRVRVDCLFPSLAHSISRLLRRLTILRLLASAATATRSLPSTPIPRRPDPHCTQVESLSLRILDLEREVVRTRETEAKGRKRRRTRGEGGGCLALRAIATGERQGPRKQPSRRRGRGAEGLTQKDVGHGPARSSPRTDGSRLLESGPARPGIPSQPPPYPPPRASPPPVHTQVAALRAAGGGGGGGNGGGGGGGGVAGAMAEGGPAATGYYTGIARRSVTGP